MQEAGASCEQTSEARGSCGKNFGRSCLGLAAKRCHDCERGDINQKEVPPGDSTVLATPGAGVPSRARGSSLVQNCFLGEKTSTLHDDEEEGNLRGIYRYNGTGTMAHYSKTCLTKAFLIQL